MQRLALYLAELADMLGSIEHVHFSSVTPGSAMLNIDIDELRYSEVLTSVREAPAGKGTARQLKGYRELQRLMEEDGTAGEILDHSSRSIMLFAKSSNDESPLSINKQGSVQGRLYRIGGKDETVPVRLEGANGETLNCEASTEIAQQLSALLFQQVRVSGPGIWERSPDGGWKLKKLKIESFQKLDSSKLGSVLAKLQAAGGLQWAEMENPHSVAKDLRG